MPTRRIICDHRSRVICQWVSDLLGWSSPPVFSGQSPRIQGAQALCPCWGVEAFLSCGHPLTSEVDQLRAEVGRLRDLISALQVAPPWAGLDHPTHRSCSHSRATSPHPSALEISSLCWYHRQFGEKACKCVDPCTWSRNALARRWWRPTLPAKHQVTYFV